MITVKQIKTEQRRLVSAWIFMHETPTTAAKAAGVALSTMLRWELGANRIPDLTASAMRTEIRARLSLE